MLLPILDPDVVHGRGLGLLENEGQEMLGAHGGGMMDVGVDLENAVEVPPLDGLLILLLKIVVEAGLSAWHTSDAFGISARGT